jgi:hypothetical protein
MQKRLGCCKKTVQLLGEPFSLRDFYFHALGSLVMLSFPQLLIFSSVFPKTLSETITGVVTAGCPTVDRYLLIGGAT